MEHGAAVQDAQLIAVRAGPQAAGRDEIADLRAALTRKIELQRRKIDRRSADQRPLDMQYSFVAPSAADESHQRDGQVRAHGIRIRPRQRARRARPG